MEAIPVFEGHAAHFAAIHAAAIAAADPAESVRAAVLRGPVPADEPVWVVAIGKAAGAMFEGFRTATGRHHDAVMVVPEGAPAQAWALRADHPLPTVRSVEAGEAVRDFVKRQARAAEVGGHGGFVVLISGGASALVTLPEPSIPLAEYRSVTGALLRSGEPIGVINTVRRHCEQIKGGRLVAMMGPAWVRAYILSDVIGDSPADIASGPVSPDASTFDEAFRIVERAAPGATSVLAHLDAGRFGRIAETPRAGDAVFERVRWEIVGSNRMAVQAAAVSAVDLGFEVGAVTLGVVGDAAEAGRELARRAMEARRLERPTAILMGGETTVAVGEAEGVGGRCQELALSAAIAIDGWGGIAIGAVATDGVDGPPGPGGPVPAGAIVTGGTAVACRKSGVDPAAALANHDSRAALRAANALLETGPTGTNVNDLMIALVYPE